MVEIGIDSVLMQPQDEGTFTILQTTKCDDEVTALADASSTCSMLCEVTNVVIPLKGQ